jgi:hypothetical protein
LCTSPSFNSVVNINEFPHRFYEGFLFAYLKIRKPQ